jgi:hypothetical protein
MLFAAARTNMLPNFDIQPSIYHDHMSDVPVICDVIIVECAVQVQTSPGCMLQG